MQSTTWATLLRAAAGALAALLVSGCASFSGSSLVPGKSTEAEIRALMGPPDETIKLDTGDTEWFYTRPAARQTYAIVVGPDGRFRASEQRLDRTYIDRIRSGWTIKEVRTLLGPPDRVVRFERQQRDVWTYRWRDYSDRRLLHVQFSYDGEVREVLDMMDPAYIPAGPGVHFGGDGRLARRS